ncbi:MAG: outer membrane protein assembly factor BamE [Rhodobacterales bacterium]|nr:outer membrane protein assembly factor BamE [Rhodobacterales bacterium]
MFGSKIIIRTALVAVLVVGVAGCTATYRDHGYVPTEDEVSEIIVGVDTRASVETAIGIPGITGVLDEGGLYYVQSRVKQFAFYKPEVVEREVLAISFNQAQVVSNIERFSLADGQIVPLSRRVTSSSVLNNGFLRQLLGNLGRFTAGDFLQ